MTKPQAQTIRELDERKRERERRLLALSFAPISEEQKQRNLEENLELLCQ